MKTYLKLFWIFCKIGTFTLGGGFAMLPLIEREIVDLRGWINQKEFLDMVATAQSAPGVMAVNLAVFVGYKMRGIWGSLVCALGATLPSFVIILAIALFFHQFEQNEIVRRVFMGIRPAVAALIAVPVFNLAKAAEISWKTVWVPLLCAGLIWLMGVSPVYIILLAGLGGFLFCRPKTEAGK